jgi:hypothetical protein
MTVKFYFFTSVFSEMNSIKMDRDKNVQGLSGVTKE